MTLPVRLGLLKDLIKEPNGNTSLMFQPIPGRLEFALQKMGHNLRDVEEFLQEVVEERLVPAIT